MHLLIDYANVPDALRRCGAHSTILRLIDEIPAKLLASQRDLIVRLYGGWYEENALSRDGQRVSAEIAAAFPVGLQLGMPPGGQLTVSAELAHSLFAAPHQVLGHTLRSRLKSWTRCKDPVSCGCTDSSCPLSHMHGFLNREHCPRPNCAITPAIMFPPRREQKLVDTMLVADLMYLAASQKPAAIAMASSDDDMWPGIISALGLGIAIIHIQTKPNALAVPYHAGIHGDYHAVQLWSV